MSPVVSALLAFLAGLFRSRAALCLEHLALRHQLAVYQRPLTARASVRPIGCSGYGWLDLAGLARCPGLCPAPHSDRLAAAALS